MKNLFLRWLYSLLFFSPSNLFFLYVFLLAAFLCFAVLLWMVSALALFFPPLSNYKTFYFPMKEFFLLLQFFFCHFFEFCDGNCFWVIDKIFGALSRFCFTVLFFFFCSEKLNGSSYLNWTFFSEFFLQKCAIFCKYALKRAKIPLKSILPLFWYLTMHFLP